MNSPRGTRAVSTSRSRNAECAEYGTNELLRWFALAGLLIMIVIFGALEMLLMLPLAPEPPQIEMAVPCSPSEPLSCATQDDSSVLSGSAEDRMEHNSVGEVL